MPGALHLRRSAPLIRSDPRDFMMNTHLIGNYHGNLLAIASTAVIPQFWEMSFYAYRL